MVRLLSLALALPALGAVPAPADTPKAPDRPVGVWSREVGATKLRFTIRAERLVRRVEDDAGNTVDARAAYGVTEDGTLFGIVTGADTKGAGQEPPRKGELFSFRYKLDKDTLTISDLQS